MRRLVPAVSLALASACAVTPPQTLDPATRESLGRIAVVAVDRPPKVELAGIPSGKGSGAASGAAEAGAQCLGSFGSGAAGCSGIGCAGVVLLIAVVCPAAAVAGGIMGASTAPASDTFDAGRARLEQAAAPAALQLGLREQVAHWARTELGARYVELADPAARLAAPKADYRALGALGVGCVLEASVEDLRLESIGGRGGDPSVVMTARVRIVRTADASVAYDEAIRFYGGRRKLADWVADEARPLQADIERAYAELGRAIVERAFFVYPFPGHAQGAEQLKPYGLAARSYAGGGWRMFLPGTQWPKVDSLTPLLAWEPFPRASDRAAKPADMARVANVGYDLVIAREQNLAAARVVYRREGLATPEHRVEAPLEPGRRYLWTVRARFELDGRAYLTDWARTGPSSEVLVAPSLVSYSFSTP